MSDPPLWTCPRCGARLITRHLWHSCGEATLETWKARMGPNARTLFDGFEALVAACGPYDIAPAKTRITFLARVRFAGITALSERGMTCNFALPEPVAAERFARVEEIAPGWWQHRLRITHPAQLDAQLGEWICRSYHLMGLRERLRQGP